MVVMSKIEANKARKRVLILSAAQKIFLSDGYERTSMDVVSAEAGVTKQTLYRYFPSKIDLFQATLRYIGEQHGGDSTQTLEHADIKKALLAFAEEFIQFHVSFDHIALYRLLVAESGQFPEILDSFETVRSDNTMAQLITFFKQRLTILKPETTIQLWLGMLLNLRGSVLMGGKPPSKKQIKDHAQVATELLLASMKE
jgi:AcrR family transcriptional regulator